MCWYEIALKKIETSTELKGPYESRMQEIQNSILYNIPGSYKRKRQRELERAIFSVGTV